MTDCFVTEQNADRVVLTIASSACGRYGVVTMSVDGEEVCLNIYAFTQAVQLHDQLLEAGGSYQAQYLEEAAEATYLADDLFGELPREQGQVIQLTQTEVHSGLPVYEALLLE